MCRCTMHDARCSMHDACVCVCVHGFSTELLSAAHFAERTDLPSITMVHPPTIGYRPYASAWTGGRVGPRMRSDLIQTPSALAF